MSKKARTSGELIAAWPPIEAEVREDGTGSITIAGTERACAAPSPAQLRTGILARSVALALELGRPVRLHVTEGGERWPFGVRPEGIVQSLHPDGTVDPAENLAPITSPCRACGLVQPITTALCSACGTAEPHRVETEPRGLGRNAAPTAIRLTFSTQPPITMTQGVVLGRQPASIDGRHPVPVSSPERMMSKTHLTVDLQGSSIVVVDQGSVNGTLTQTEPPDALAPGQPRIIESGTVLLLGDVLCTFETITQ